MSLFGNIYKIAVARLKDGTSTTEFARRDGTWATPSGGASFPVGSIIAYGGSSAPSGGWALCDGSAVNRTTFASLFTAISTAFGIGDGSTTFNLPDLRQRFPLGKAASGTGSTLGGTGGNIDHDHGLNLQSALNSNISGPTSTQTVEGAAVVTPVSVAADDHLHTFTDTDVFTTTNNPPFQSVNFIIKTT